MRARQDSFAIIAEQGFGAVGKRLNQRVNWSEPQYCWEYFGHTVNGYGRIRVGNVRILAHRVAWIVANRADPGEMLVCHTCDNRRCCNPKHLFLGTALDNVRDMDAKGRCGRVGGGRSVITASDAAIIRGSVSDTHELASQFGISATQVRLIRSGHRWNPDAAAKRRAGRVPSDLLKIRSHNERSDTL